jgi:hypothetical protein
MVTRWVTCAGTTRAKAHGGSAYGCAARAARCLSTSPARTFITALIAQLWPALRIDFQPCRELFSENVVEAGEGQDYSRLR